jgi:glyoxylase-like metal-dependent hydrolase (beta-lactamase superfamily II)
MKFSRKDFLKTGAIVAGGMLLKGHKLFSAVQTQTGTMKQLKDNCGIYLERGGTIGWYATNDVVVVIDSQYPETAKKFIAELQKKTQHRIDLFFNTHHHGDHTAGNTYIKDFADRMIAHENCVELQKKNYGNDPNKPQTYPDLTFKKEWLQDIGSEIVAAKYFGIAHTGGDSVIHFEKANIAHVGDLVFNKTFPFIDSNGGGSVVNWANVLNSIVNYYPKDTTYIFGHAISDEFITGNASDVIAMKNYLSALVEFVSNEIKNGKTKEEIASAAEIPGFADLKERWQGARKMNIEKTYDELIKK